MNFHLFKSWYIGTIGIGAIGIEIGIGAIGIEIGAIGTSDLDDGLNRIVSNEKGKLSVPKAIRETELYDLDTEKYMTLEEWWKVQLHEHNENWVGFWYLWIIEIWNLAQCFTNKNISYIIYLHALLFSDRITHTCWELFPSQINWRKNG